MLLEFRQWLIKLYAQQFENAGDQLFIRIITVLLIVIAVIAIIVGVIFFQQALRKIPIQYAKRVVAGRNPVGGQSTHLPLKVNAAGVIPVIFAVSFIVTPRTIASFFQQNDVTLWIQKIFDYTHPIGMVIYAALIIAFTYFYAFIQVNPEQVAENLKKQGGYIPGIRPGKKYTRIFNTRTLYRLTFVGAIFLAVIAILPVFFSKVAGLPQSATNWWNKLTYCCRGCT